MTDPDDSGNRSDSDEGRGDERRTDDAAERESGDQAVRQPAGGSADSDRGGRQRSTRNLDRGEDEGETKTTTPPGENWTRVEKTPSRTGGYHRGESLEEARYRRTERNQGAKTRPRRHREVRRRSDVHESESEYRYSGAEEARERLEMRHERREAEDEGGSGGDRGARPSDERPGSGGSETSDGEPSREGGDVREPSDREEIDDRDRPVPEDTSSGRPSEPDESDDTGSPPTGPSDDDGRPTHAGEDDTRSRSSKIRRRPRRLYGFEHIEQYRERTHRSRR